MNSLKVSNSSFFSDLQIRILDVQKTFSGLWWNFTDKSPFARIYYVLKGEAFVYHHNKEFRLMPGHSYLIPSNTFGRYRCEKLMVHYWTHVTANILGSLDLFSYLDFDYEKPFNPAADMEKFFLKLKNDFKAKTPKGMLEADGIVRIFLSSFLPANFAFIDQEKFQIMKRFEPVFTFIETHLSHSISIAELAGLLNLQTNYFSNIFTNIFGISPLQHIQKRRMEMAQGLLWHSSLSLKEIGEQLGFTDSYYLSKLFKKKIGMPPSIYRNKIKQGIS